MDEKKLQENINELRERITDLENKPVILDRYLDVQSKDIIEEVITERFFDIYWNEFFIYNMLFQDLGGFTTNGNVSIGSGTTILTTGTTIGDTVSLDAGVTITSGGNSFSEESRFKTNILVDSVAAQDVFIGVGDVIGVGAHSYGFFIDDSTLKGFVQTNSTNRTTLDLQTVSSATEIFLEALFYPNERVDFLIDKVLIGSITDATNFPTIFPAMLWSAHVETSAAAAKVLRIHFFDYLQRRIN